MKTAALQFYELHKDHYIAMKKELFAATVLFNKKRKTDDDNEDDDEQIDNEETHDKKRLFVQ